MKRELVVLDTNVASFLFDEAPAWDLYEPALQGKRFAISFQTIAEMLEGARRAAWPAHQLADLDRFLRDFKIVSYERPLADMWAFVRAETARRGRRLDPADAWIAAAAVQRRAKLVTHDPDFRDLEIAGLEVICHAP